MAGMIYVEVVGPEGVRYWNPIKETRADTYEACETLLDNWIIARIRQSNPMRHTVATFRATRRFKWEPNAQ